MKRILLSVLTISLVGAITIGATGAYFSDTETSTGNTFTAGTIDLALNGNNPYSGTALLTLSDIKPSQDLAPLTLILKNVGQNEGKLTVTFTYVEKDKYPGEEPQASVFEFTSNGDATMDMSADQFASLVYVEAATEDTVDILPALLTLYNTNDDGKVSLYELASKPLPWSSVIAPYYDTLKPDVSTTLVVELHLGDSLESPGTAGSKILTNVQDNRPQADGIELSVTATLKQVVMP